MNSSLSDARLTRVLALLLALTFLVASIILLLLQFNVTAAAPEFRQGDEVLVDNILIGFAAEQVRWPQDFLLNILFAIGFAAVAGLGATLPQLIGERNGATRVVGASLVLAGALGIAGQLIYLGVKEIAISTTYCECALRDSQLISRSIGLDLAVNAQAWFIDAFAVVFGIGLILASRIAMSGAVSAGWRRYSLWFGVVAIVVILVRRLLTALGGPEGSFDDLALLLLALVAAILTPVWGWLTAREFAR